jgi:hypothetical protein
MSYAIAGVGDDEGGGSPCPPGANWVDGQGCVCTSSDSVMINGQCRDKSVLCGPGTQWVDADKACVPLTKYMAPSQIAAAIQAGINLTGGGPQPAAAVATRPAVVPAAAPSPFATLASVLTGPSAPWVIGGLAVGVLGLALLSKSSPSRRTHSYAR